MSEIKVCNFRGKHGYPFQGSHCWGNGFDLDSDMTTHFALNISGCELYKLYISYLKGTCLEPSAIKLYLVVRKLILRYYNVAVVFKELIY